MAWRCHGDQNQLAVYEAWWNFHSLSLSHTHAVSCLMVPCMWTSEIENYFTRTESRVPHLRTTTSQLQKGRPGGAASVIECGRAGLSATLRHDVTFCQKTHWLGSWRDRLIVFCSVYLLLGVWRWLGWLSVAESECMCVFSKRASVQAMTCPIEVGLDTAWFASPHISLATHRLRLSPSEIQYIPSSTE